MTKLILFLILTICLVSCVSSFGKITNSNYSKYQPNAYYAKSRVFSKSSEPVQQNKKVAATQRGFGLSAWGLVFLIVSIILTGVGAYYMVIFYPLLCKKERKYDRIELSAV